MTPLIALAVGAPAAEAAGTLASASGPPAAASSTSAQLASMARTAPRRPVIALVQFKPGVSQRRATAIARSAGARVAARVPLIHGLALAMPAAKAQALKHRAGVLNVTLNNRVRSTGISASNLATSYPKSAGAVAGWNYGDTGVTGRGIGVAVIDSGVAGDLPDFKGADGRSRVVANVVVNPFATSAGDPYGHGTHVAGILAGNGWKRSLVDPLRGAYVGAAPEANIVAVKAGDDNGNASVLDVINGLQFVVDHQADYNIRVVNLSMQAAVPSSYKTDPLDAAVEQAWFKGITVVTAAGNRGSAPDAEQYAPSNDPYAITVGAMDDQGTQFRSDDVVAAWSGTGTTQDGVAKPDVLAPGAHIVSTLAPSSQFALLCPTCILSGSYIRVGGTSMAAPVVSGLAAQLLQLHPTWTPNQVKDALTGTDKGIAGTNGGEVQGELALGYAASSTRVNQGLTPNALIDTTTGTIDYTRSSWSRSSWSTATGGLNAGWSLSSWSCTCGRTTSGSIDPTLSSWSLSSWSSRPDM